MKLIIINLAIFIKPQREKREKGNIFLTNLTNVLWIKKKTLFQQNTFAAAEQHVSSYFV